MLKAESITWWCSDCGHRMKQKMNEQPPQECTKCCGVTKMSFGKYKGVDICFVNSGYLKWVLDQDWFLKIESNESLVLAIERELENRDRSDGHFYEDKVTV